MNSHPLYDQRTEKQKAFDAGFSEGARLTVDLEAALRILYEEQISYIKLNHLGNPHHNLSMKLARDALRRFKDWIRS
jgi:hypothetical protein